MRNVLKLSEADFALPNDAFVQRCLTLAQLTEEKIGTIAYHQLIESLNAGKTRFEVAQAIAHLASPQTQGSTDFLYNALSQEMEIFIVAELLINFAPDNDAAFLAFTANKILGRAPKINELLSLEFDLRRKKITRLASIEYLVAIARSEGRHVICEGLGRASSTPGIGFTFDAEGKSQFLAIQSLENNGWAVSPHFIRQKIQFEKDGWKLNPGWVFSGPKESFIAGTWLLELDFIQPPLAKLVIDVIANSGLDVLFYQEFIGSATVSVKLDINKNHKFLELRLLKPHQDNHLCWLMPRRFALVNLESESKCA